MPLNNDGIFSIHHLFLEISHNVKLNYFLIRKFVFLGPLEAARYFMLVSNIVAVGYAQ
jgi:hypothetical protein